MRNVHHESENDRLVRVTEFVKSLVRQDSTNVDNVGVMNIFDCSECGLLFQTREEQNSHNQKDHASELICEVLEKNKEEENLIDNKESEDSSSEEDFEEEEDNINIEYQYNEEGETFKGNKPLFVQSVIALKRLINEKSEPKIINKHTMVVKDVRVVKYEGIEAEVEVSKGAEKGVATLKIWGPSRAAKGKKKCTVMSVKYSSCDEKFATILSRKIIKPLLDSYLKGLGWKSMIKYDNVKKEKNMDRQKQVCPHCEKQFVKSYLKTHIEKMHCVQCNICENKFKNDSDMKTHRELNHSQTAINIVKDVLNTRQDVTKIKTVTPSEKQDVFICNHCDMKFVTNLELIEHKGKNHIDDNWPDSGSKRDVSMVKSSSVHEPKKKRAAEDDEMRERSENMDRKIMEKRKREELEEVLRKKSMEETKRKENMNHELNKKRKKKEKQKHKEQNATKLQDKLNNETFKEDKSLFQKSNIKELPEKVKHLHPDCLEYCVRGDGACCLNCLAAWIYLDETQGPQLGRDLNTHLAQYRPYYKDKLVFPLTITVLGGLLRTFDKGEEEEFFDYLLESPEASFMWRESADMIGLTNFTQMEVEVNIYNREADSVITQIYKPDPEFPWNTDDANSPNINNYEKMTLLNYENVHFNLIVKRDHPLLEQDKRENTEVNHKPGIKSTPAPNPPEAGRKIDRPGKVDQSDSQGDGKNVRSSDKLKTFDCQNCKKVFKENAELISHNKSEHKDEYIQVMEKRMQEAVQSRDSAIKERQESNDKIQKLVEEMERIKIENKELKVQRRGNKTNIQKSPGDKYDVDDEVELDSEREILKGKQSGFRRNGPQLQPTQIFKCPKCDNSLKDKIALEKHLESHKTIEIKCKTCGERFDKESDLEFHSIYEHVNIYQWNCMKCPFQTNEKMSLKKHFDIKHTDKQSIYQCESCKREFESQWHLKNHIRDEHGKIEECSHFKENRCKFANTCWKKHIDLQSGLKNVLFICFSCKQSFKTINDLMSHKKKEHIEFCKPCSPKNGVCRFEKIPEKCWYIHEDFQLREAQQVPPLNQPAKNVVRSSENL